MTNELTKEDIWIDRVGTWYEPLKILWESKAMENLMNFVEDNRLMYNIFPYNGNEFKAFQICEYDECKLILLGNCPSPYSFQGKPYSNGLLFDESNVSNDYSSMTTTQFDAFFGEYERYSPHHFAAHMMCGDTNTIGMEGVLLLNSALTTQENIMNCHNDKWIPFTKGFLTRIKDREIPLIAFGSVAKTVCEEVGYANLYTVDHPGQAAALGQQWKPFGEEVNLFDKMSALMGRKVDW